MKQKFKIIFYQIAILFILLIVWELIVRGSSISSFLYGSPIKILQILITQKEVYCIKLRFMITTDQVKDITTRIDNLQVHLNIEQKQIEIQNEEEKTFDPSFWDNPSEAEEFMKTLKGKKKWVNDYNVAKSGLEELQVHYLRLWVGQLHVVNWTGKYCRFLLCFIFGNFRIFLQLPGCIVKTTRELASGCSHYLIKQVKEPLHICC